MLLNRRRIGTVAAVLAAAALASCGPASERPVRGALPGSPPPSPAGVPPTLTPNDVLRFRALATPSPGLEPSPSVPAVPASPSVVAAPPIVRTIVPSANGRVPGGAPVTLSAVLVGRGADLASASLSVNGANAGAQIDKRSAREWTIHTSQTLPNGMHTVRVLVRDASGAAGGFTWRFLVGDEQTPVPNP